jgi:hypothetical protein
MIGQLMLEKTQQFRDKIAVVSTIGLPLNHRWRTIIPNMFVHLKFVHESWVRKKDRYPEIELIFGQKSDSD